MIEGYQTNIEHTRRKNKSNILFTTPTINKTL